MDGAPEGQIVSIAGRVLVCPHCGTDRFRAQNYRIPTLFRTGLWADSATAFVCVGCGRAELYFDPPIDEGPALEVAESAESAPDAAPDSDAPPVVTGPTRPLEPGESLCLNCRAVIPVDKDACPACGWTYR